MIETIKGGWVLLVLGGMVGVAGLLLAAILPSRFEETASRCGLDLASNAGVLQRSLGLTSCRDDVSLSAEVELALDGFAPDAALR